MREILKKDPPASVRLYGTHYDIRFTHKEMVRKPLLFAEPPGDTAQEELCEDYPFALRSVITSAATMPCQRQAGCDAEGDTPPATGTLLKDPSKVRNCVREGQLSSPTDPLTSPLKDQSKETQNEAVAGVTSSNLRTRNNSV